MGTGCPQGAVAAKRDEHPNGAKSSMESSENSTTAENWQEEAARFLLRSGFRPGDAIGQVEHVANPHRAGRTFGSVWHAMRSLVESESGPAAGKAQDVVRGEIRALKK